MLTHIRHVRLAVFGTFNLVEFGHGPNEPAQRHGKLAQPLRMQGARQVPCPPAAPC